MKRFIKTLIGTFVVLLFQAKPLLAAEPLYLAMLN